MAGSPITPDEIAAAAEVYASTGNYAEAARAIGRDKSSTRRALIAAGEPLRATLHTHALARAERDARKALVKARTKLEAALDTAAEVKDLAAIAAQIHDNARATSTMRTSHARLIGDHAPDKHEITVDAVDEISRRIARLAESDDESEGSRGSQ